MKIILPFFFAALCVQLNAQVQTGLTREQNSKKKPIAGVQINFSGAVPTTSDDSGSFRLAFQGKKPGDFIFYSEIQKQGYELVNGKELEMLKISSTERLGVDIILAKAGRLDAAKKEYYQVSNQALLAGFKRKKQEWQEQIKNSEISQQEFLDKFKDLQEQYDRQQKLLDELAEKFAKVNFDDVSEVYREALELFKAGQVDEAIKKLEDTDFLSRSGKHIIEGGRIKKAAGDLADQKTEIEKGIQEDIQAMLQQVRIYLLKNQPNDALPYFEMLLQVDGDNPATLLECADFFKNNGSPEQALPLFKKVVEHTESNNEQKAKATEVIISLTQKKD